MSSIAEIAAAYEKATSEFLAIAHNVPESKLDVCDFNFASVSASLLMNEIGNGVGIRFRYTIASPTDTDIDISKWMDLNPSSE